MQKIGLFGGTFDPIHQGHLHIARAFADELDLSQMIFLPAGEPYHKAKVQTAAQHRLAMVQLTIADDPRFAVSDCDAVRQGATYTFDTIQAFRQSFPNCRLHWLMGMDSLLTLHTWKHWQALVQQINLVIAARSGESLTQLPAVLQTWLPQALKNKTVHFLTASEYPISSSEIRWRLQHNMPVDEHLPAAVWNYIQENRLYQTDK